jgi:hypothetical protein
MELIVRGEEIERVRSNLQLTPTLSEVLGEDWINNNLLNKEERLKKHALFWLILDENKCKIIDSWLQILKPSLPQSKFVGVVNDLKRKREEIEFYSYLSEIEVLAFYKKSESANFSVEFEPRVPGTTKWGDIKLTIDGREIFLEVTRLFSSDEEREFDERIAKVRKGIDELEDNPYVIGFGISEDFFEGDIIPFIGFIHEKIIENGPSITLPTGKIPLRDGKAWFSLYKKHQSGRGYAGHMLGPVIEIKSSTRLKNRILEKIEQLPEGCLNLVVLNISHPWAHFENAEDAFNGAIDMEESKHVSAIVAFEDFDYGNRRIYVNSQASTLLTNEILEKI